MSTDTEWMLAIALAVIYLGFIIAIADTSANIENMRSNTGANTNIGLFNEYLCYILLCFRYHS